MLSNDQKGSIHLHPQWYCKCEFFKKKRCRDESKRIYFQCYSPEGLKEILENESVIYPLVVGKKYFLVENSHVPFSSMVSKGITSPVLLRSTQLSAFRVKTETHTETQPVQGQGKPQRISHFTETSTETSQVS